MRNTLTKFETLCKYFAVEVGKHVGRFSLVSRHYIKENYPSFPFPQAIDRKWTTVHCWTRWIICTKIEKFIHFKHDFFCQMKIVLPAGCMECIFIRKTLINVRFPRNGFFKSHPFPNCKRHCQTLLRNISTYTIEFGTCVVCMCAKKGKQYFPLARGDKHGYGKWKKKIS